MSEFTHTRITVHSHEWRVPIGAHGAAIAEIYRAAEAAAAACKEITGDPNADRWDDWLRVRHDDDAIVLFFTTQEAAS